MTYLYEGSISLTIKFHYMNWGMLNRDGSPVTAHLSSFVDIVSYVNLVLPFNLQSSALEATRVGISDVFHHSIKITIVKSLFS